MRRNDRPSILVVEDENVVAMDLGASLEKLRYPVAGIASTGEEAISLAASRRPGLVLMDIHLRGAIDGIEAARRIQESFFIPVVYLTAYSDEATLARARISNPFGYVLKPFEDRELEVAIQIALQRHELELAIRDGERRLDAILRSIGDAVIATDAEKRITFLNPAAEKLLAWKTERARGRPIAEVLRVSPKNGNLVLLRPQDAIEIELEESPVLDAAGKVTGYVTAARDVSARIRAQESHEREIAERAARGALEDENRRARLKSDISLVLADQQIEISTALRQVAALLAPEITDWCLLYVEEEPEPVRIAYHPDPATEAVFRNLRWPSDRDSPHGIRSVLRSGRAQLVESISDDQLARVAQDREHLETLRSLGAVSYVCAPLRSRGQVLGALAFLSTDRRRPFGTKDLVFAEQVGDRLGMAIDNARLRRATEAAKADAERRYEAERKTRAEAETLYRIADTLAETRLDLHALVQKVTDEATALVGAKYGAFFYNVVNESGEEYQLFTLSGAPREAFEKFGMPRNTPLFAPTFAGSGIVRCDDVRKDPRHGKNPPHHGMPKEHLPVVSYLAVPVVSRNREVIGGLFFGHPDPGRFTERDERMAKALAAHAGIAIDNARLFTATREAEEKKTKLVRELEGAVRFSEMFVGILGHDLRNPLAGITTAAALIQTRADSDRISRPAGRILSSASRMSRMIDQILDFTHVRLGQGIPLTLAPTDLVAVCKLVLDEFRDEAVGRELRLEAVGDTKGVWDEDRLGQLVSNLAGNAIQHGTPRTPVILAVDGSQKERVTLNVRNDGVISGELLPTLFEPLRSAESKRQGSSGLGLGLFISQQVALAHGGMIRVKSDESSGTCFTVDLPRTSPRQRAVTFTRDAAAEDPK